MQSASAKLRYAKWLVPTIAAVGFLAVVTLLASKHQDVQRVSVPANGAPRLAQSVPSASGRRGSSPRPPVGVVAASMTLPSTELWVPRATGTIVTDGDIDDAAWGGRLGRTGPLTDARGESARPYSDARFLWSKGLLHVVLYAADEDIRTPPSGAGAAVAMGGAPRRADPKPVAAAVEYDFFHLTFDDGKTVRALDVTPVGGLTYGGRPSSSPPDAPFVGTWSSVVTVGHDLDGTPNSPMDQDEEWVIELAIPLASIGLEGVKGEQIAFSISRCDKPKESARVCGSWGTSTPSRLVLE